MISLCQSDKQGLIRALEGRAVAFERSKDFDKSIHDAKTIITVAPHCEKGYLRLGKIYRLRSQFDKALRIYKIGLKKTRHAEISKQIASTEVQVQKQGHLQDTTVSLFSSFPKEIFIKIFTYCSIPTIVRLLDVDRSGQDYQLVLQKSTLSLPITNIGKHLTLGILSFPPDDLYTRNIYISPTKESLRGSRSLRRKSFVKDHKIKTVHVIKTLASDWNALQRILCLLPDEARLVFRECQINYEHFSELSRSKARKIDLLCCKHDNFLPSDAEFVEYKSQDGLISCSRSEEHLLRFARRRLVVREGSFGGFNSIKGTTNQLLGLPFFPFRILNLVIDTDVLDTNSLTDCINHCPWLLSLHVVTSIYDIDDLLKAIRQCSRLREIGIHYWPTNAPKIVEPGRLVKKLLENTGLGLIYLPIFHALPLARKSHLQGLSESCRILFDQALGESLLSRLWHIPKKYYA